MGSIATRKHLSVIGVVSTGVLGFAQVSAEQADAGTGLEEVVVTAQRREENQQTIPVSVSSLSTSALENANVESALDLSKLVPSLAVNANSNSVTVFMRGVGSNVTAIGSEASVAVYVDGVYYSRLAPALMRLNNIDHIEVLNGPQGTLFGRNASGGLINIITADPSPGDPFSLKTSVGYGDYGTIDAATHSAFGLGSNMAADVAVNYHDQQEGYGKNLVTGDDRPVDRSTSVRAKLVTELGDATRVKLTGEYVDASENLAKGTNYRGYTQGFPIGSGVVGALPTVGFYDSNTDFSDLGWSEMYGASLRVEHDLSFATLINTLSYHDMEQRNPFDVDVSPLNFQTSDLLSKSTDLLNELQLLSRAGGSVDWAAGLFYMDQDQKYRPAAFGGTSIEALFGPGGQFVMYSRSRVKSIAPYAQVRFELAPKLKATLGARYTRDELKGDGFQGFVLGGSMDIGVIPGTAATSDDTFSKVTWKGGLDYQFTDDLFAYAAVSRGYKGATLNLLPFSPAATKPEVLDAYELGVKSEWFDRRLRANGSVFYYDITDPQVIVIAEAVSPTVKNAGSAEVKGVELQLEAAPTDSLDLRLAVTWLDAEYKEYDGAAFYTARTEAPFGNLPPEQRSAAGNKLPYAPDLTVNLGGRYHWTLGSGASLAVGGNYAHSAKQYFQPDNAVAQDSYGLLDAYASYTFANAPFTVKVWGANLTDEQYYTGLVQFGNAGGNIGFLSAPRTYGINFEYAYEHGK